MRSQLAVALFALSGTARFAAAQQPVARSVPGTYRIAVCERAPCSPLGTTGAAALGTLVLLDSAIALASLPEKARQRLRPSYLDGPANGCFALQRSFVPTASLAGAAPVGVTRWTMDSAGHVTFTLYQSPDARHTVRATLLRERLRGRGDSFLALGGVHRSRDTVVAVRVAPADIAPCIEASVLEYKAPMPFGRRPRFA